MGKEKGWQELDVNRNGYGTQLQSVHSIKHTNPDHNSTASLFISIASYRDSLCPVTLFNLYTKAQHPGRIHVGLIQQNNHDEDIDCLEGYCDLMKHDSRFGNIDHQRNYHCPFRDQITIRRINADHANGPQYARALGSDLLLSPPLESFTQDYCMQTDAHMNFVSAWDIKMIDMWTMTQNEYAILSTYVAPLEQMEVQDNPTKNGFQDLHEVPHLCMVEFSGEYGLPRNWGTKCARMLPFPKLTNALWGAGLSFSKCHAEKKVPYDPHLPYIFDGEEVSRAVRFWTYGYDIYTPHRVYVLHDYSKSQADPKHMAWVKARRMGSKSGHAAGGSEDETSGGINKNEEGKILPYDEPSIDIDNVTPLQSAARIKQLLQIEEHTVFPMQRPLHAVHDNFHDIHDISPQVSSSLSTANIYALQRSKYGLGDRRSLQSCMRFMGIDFTRRRRLVNRCGNIDYIPFREHPKGSEYIYTFTSNSNESFVGTRDKNSVWYNHLQDSQGDEEGTTYSLRGPFSLLGMEKFFLFSYIHSYVYSLYHSDSEINIPGLLLIEDVEEEYSQRNSMIIWLLILLVALGGVLASSMTIRNEHTRVD